MNRIDQCRKKIDLIDKKIVSLLMLRFGIAKQISIYKKRNNIKILDRRRELEVMKNIKKHSDKKNQKSMLKIFKNIINHSKKLQE